MNPNLVDFLNKHENDNLKMTLKIGNKSANINIEIKNLLSLFNNFNIDCTEYIITSLIKNMKEENN